MADLTPGEEAINQRRDAERLAQEAFQHLQDVVAREMNEKVTALVSELREKYAVNIIPSFVETKIPGQGTVRTDFQWIVAPLNQG